MSPPAPPAAATCSPRPRGRRRSCAASLAAVSSRGRQGPSAPCTPHPALPDRGRSPAPATTPRPARARPLGPHAPPPALPGGRGRACPARPFQGRGSAPVAPLSRPTPFREGLQPAPTTPAPQGRTSGSSVSILPPSFGQPTSQPASRSSRKQPEGAANTPPAPPRRPRDVIPQGRPAPPMTWSHVRPPAGCVVTQARDCAVAAMAGGCGEAAPGSRGYPRPSRVPGGACLLLRLGGLLCGRSPVRCAG
ncbi:vegetative cell wall protein gp1-like [Phacochoerus africanus]|uniref:vegetative cell wall protein gp1-like n=1 Tax=Phacochoerus africanus TaxID=41426 RepID=UPI001FDA4803|nr:vegetative cell wall protein gp1-like [Phacochoerus africanus]